VCGSACVDLTSDPNNCGSCGHACGNSMGCAGSQCVCTASTPNGANCMRPGQVPGTCWSGACVLPTHYAGCTTAADCVPGGCVLPAGICLGTTSVPGQVSCSDYTPDYVVCAASVGCSFPVQRTHGDICGDGANGTGVIRCDGPNDCPANQDCCYHSDRVAMMECYPQTTPGVIGSGCPMLGPNAWAPNVCDPLNPTATCPQGKSCTPSVVRDWTLFLCE
jgi:hypothetical protein